MSLPSPWTPAREAGETIASNARFVLRELSFDVPFEWRQRVETVWRSLAGGAERIAATAARGERGTMRYPIDELEWLDSGLGGVFRELDQLVRDLGATEEVAGGQASRGAMSVLSILVTESAAIVVRSYGALKQHARTMRLALAQGSSSPSLRTQAGLAEGADLLRRLACSECGRTAATLEVGIDPLSGDRALIYRGLVRGEAFRCEGTGDVFAKLDQGRVGEVHKELGQEGIDAYCPACDRVYCDQHYRLQTEYDEGFYDCTRATCPAGHQRMVDD